MKKLIARLSVIIAAVVMLVGSTGALNVAAATKIPQTVTVPSSADAGMGKPTGLATIGTGYKVPANWKSQSGSITDEQRVAYVTSGQSIIVYTPFNNFLGASYLGYQSVLKVGSAAPTYGPHTTSGQPDYSADPNSSDQTNVVPSYSGSGHANDTLSYVISAPTVMQPTWVSFQSSIRIGSTLYYSTVFHMLVFPNNWVPTVNAPAAIFAGNSASVTTTPTTDGVTPGFSIDDITGGSWTGNTVKATDAGATHFEATLDLPATALGTPALSFKSPQQQITFFNINNQQVDEGDPANFAITSGGSSTFTNVHWYVNGAEVTGDGTKMTIPKTTTAMNNATVKATFDVTQNGQVVQTGVSGTANLQVSPTNIALTANPSLIFAGSDVPAGSNQSAVKMTVQNQDVTNQATWAIDDKNLATIDSTGKVTANTGTSTGTASITGSATVSGKAKTGITQIVVGRLADPGVATIGSTTTLNAPTATGSKWTYQWQRMAKGSTTWSNIQNANQATFTTPALTSDDDGAQYRVQVTMADTAKTVVTSNPVTLNVRAAGLSLLSVPDFQFKTMSGDANVGQLLKGQFDGSITDFNDRNLPTKWLIQGNPNATPVVMSNQQANPDQTNMQLSVAVAPFLNNGKPLSNAGSTAKMMLYWDDGTGTMVQKYAPDDNSQVNLYGNPGFDPLTGEASRKVSALLSIGPSPQAQPGTYTSQMTWTLTAGPTPQ
ncbi:hypothetical protein PQ472_07280 [Lacticaseibacillus pabuli]|uniref:Ig-like protein group 2 n=1 Tax=Lacticaseibacillus pabuli TaxID=3025672 RepID=A0ABY7WRQ6_9LACO|nr:hypothetical protein [Lacticaseibacillus sp. KACC 23028]WDF81729.1 hypothetical protein PQ472_07280 [Lacticaseibacillus sp. KACC 23028]